VRIRQLMLKKRLMSLVKNP